MILDALLGDLIRQVDDLGFFAGYVAGCLATLALWWIHHITRGGGA